MRVWTRTLSGRLSRKSLFSLENMAEEDNQSIHNKNNENNCVRTLKDHMNPTRTSAPSCIVFPPDAFHFNFKPGIIQLLPTFHGLELENPYLHLTDVKVRGSTNGISNKYNINSFYYSIGNHTQRGFQSDDLSLLAHHKLLT